MSRDAPQKPRRWPLLALLVLAAIVAVVVILLLVATNTLVPA